MLTRSQIESWLTEDLGHHDVTNDVPGETTGQLVAKEAGVAAGLDAALATFAYLGVPAEATVEPGAAIDVGDVVLTCQGPTTAVLRGERVAVNVTGHATGIATRTHSAVEAARSVDDRVRIACTRKTTPGLRGIEKRAVVAGGGDTHRLDLSHMVLIKDNHIAELGLETAIARMRERVSFTTNIEVEVEQAADAARAARAGADIVLLDNMDPATVKRAVGSLPARTIAEASGGITIDTVPAYAATGVDVISMGSLTHSAPSLDYSFRTGE